MIEIEEVDIHVNEYSRKNIMNYLFKIFDTLNTEGESVHGNINGVQIIMFYDRK